MDQHISTEHQSTEGYFKVFQVYSTIAVDLFKQIIFPDLHCWKRHLELLDCRKIKLSISFTVDFKEPIDWSLEKI